jgi:hypothetical protein
LRSTTAGLKPSGMLRERSERPAGTREALPGAFLRN